MPLSRRGFVGWVLLLAMAAALPAAETETDWREPGWSRLAALGSGFVVWESSRSGRWRIWRRDLDGGGLRQLTPDEAGRDHFCPHLSPDGKRLAYLSFPVGTDGYGQLPRPTGVRLCLIASAGGEPRLLAEDVRTYREDRAAVWLDDHALVWLGGDGQTWRLDVDSSERRQLTNGPAAELGWLPDATLHWATTGEPVFTAFADGRPIAGEPREGCQPYFSHDGRWGFWAGGAGGPLNRIELATGAVAAIVRDRDHRLPRDRGYVYFPMLSRCGRLFAFAASPGVHDHFNADYDIYVAACDPATLELVGAPVRYSRDPGCDRYPDVHLDGDAKVSAVPAVGDRAGSAQPGPVAAPGPPLQWRVRAHRVHATSAPTLREIVPYHEALVLHEYAVEAVPVGTPLPATIRVASWGVRNDRIIPDSGDGMIDLVLERWQDHGELHRRLLLDRLDPAPDVPQFLRVGP